MGIKKTAMNEHQKFDNYHIQWTEESSSRLWNYYSSSSAHREKYFGSRCGRQVARLLSKKLLSKVETILDYSCGRGDLLFQCVPFLKPKHKIYACDISTASIKKTSTKLKFSPNFVSASVIKNYISEIEAGSFDLVIATEVLEHLNDIELNKTLEDVSRIIRIGGFIFLTTPYQENLEKEKTVCPDCGCIFHRWQHQRSLTPDELAKIMETYGFKKIECNNILWGQWPLRLYFWITRKPGNGIYFIGKKVK